jgi:hypothetical protein
VCRAYAGLSVRGSVRAKFVRGKGAGEVFIFSPEHTTTT